MITFEKLRYRNFLSTGDAWNEINFTAHKTTLVVGHNGSGKSTMLDALSFALFGKAHRNIKKAQLVNSINKKGTVVEVEFKVHGSHFRIHRSIKPNAFEIWKDDTMINQDSHAKEYQKILEQNIIKLNHKSFHQIVVLGSSSFVPFMQLNSTNRSEVIQELLDIGVFSSMYLILREKTSLLKDKIRQNDYNIDILETKIDAAVENISKIKLIGQEQKQSKQVQIDDWKFKIDGLQVENNSLLAAVDSIQVDATASQSKFQDQVAGYKGFQQQFSMEIATLKKRSQFYEENDDCPTCSQAIGPKLKEEKQLAAAERDAELNRGIAELDEAMSVANASLSEAQVLLKTVTDNLAAIQQNNASIGHLNTNVASAMTEISNIGKGAGDLTAANNKRKLLTEELTTLEEARGDMSYQASYNRVIAELLKDTGIRTKIIKQYLPVINQVVNQYLQTLDFFVSFNLDENFQETIRSRHRDEFTYDSFSEGEKQRIDLALLFTWRMIAKMKNSVSTNLLLLDETFDSSLDDDGVDNLMKILYTFDTDTNVFVISHKGELLDGKFESKIEFYKHKNFSKMK
jgi:DNA repair exonuclease SbcCD ATPase subunit